MVGRGACIGWKAPVDSTSDSTARRSLAASRSPRASAIVWLGVLASTVSGPSIRSAVSSLATFAPRWGMRTSDAGTPRNTPVPRAPRSSRQTPRVSSIRSTVHPGVSSPVNGAGIATMRSDRVGRPVRSPWSSPKLTAPACARMLSGACPLELFNGDGGSALTGLGHGLGSTLMCLGARSVGLGAGLREIFSAPSGGALVFGAQRFPIGGH